MAKKKAKELPKAPKLNNLKQLDLNAAGIDVGSTEIWACSSEDHDSQPVQKFGTFTSDLHHIACWLRKSGVDTVAIESTGIHWIPLNDIL